MSAGAFVYFSKIDFKPFKLFFTHFIATLLPQKPCAEPLTFSVDTFDKRFGITKTNFEKDITQAGSVWEKISGRTLFENSPTGTIKINLIYDSRQRVTDVLKRSGVMIGDDQAVYSALRAKYDALTATFKNQKAEYDALVSDFNAKQEAYETLVAYWNAQGGAPKAEYAALQEQKNKLHALATELRQKQVVQNTLIDQINAMVPLLNSVAKKLDLAVTAYNELGASNGEEFSEGEYVSDARGMRINIYQFTTQDKLIRVLEHELGHALGLGHVSDTTAIMYRLNSGSNLLPTKDDIAELGKTCWK